MKLFYSLALAFMLACSLTVPRASADDGWSVQCEHASFNADGATQLMFSLYWQPRGVDPVRRWAEEACSSTGSGTMLIYSGSPEIGSDAVPAEPASALPQGGGNRLVIPAIRLDVPLVICPLNGGSWDTGNVWTQACVLEGLPTPGEGNAAIAGHYDNRDGSPSVFWRLPRLSIGDEVIVSWNGAEYRYIVRDSYLVSYTDIGVLQDTENRLTLITSAGTYRRDLGRYDSNRIIEAVPAG